MKVYVAILVLTVAAVYGKRQNQSRKPKGR